ncbi:glutathione S-transferase A-like [Glandiceps talaboti]
MASEIFLYWGSGSGPCWRVMMALEEKGLSGYGNKLVSFEKKEHKSEEILKLNPRGQVPTMKHKDVVINESMAILTYLETTFKGQGTTLIPDNDAERAAVLQKLFEISNLESKIRPMFMYLMGVKKGGPEDKEKFAKLTEDVRNELAIWDGYLAKGDGYIAGKNFSLADCAFFPAVATCCRQGVDLEKHLPNMVKYYNTVKERPSAQASWPPHFKESPSPMMFKDVY